MASAVPAALEGAVARRLKHIGRSLASTGGEQDHPRLQPVAQSTTTVQVLSDVVVSTFPDRQCAYPAVVVDTDGSIVVSYSCAYPDKHSYDGFLVTHRSANGGSTFDSEQVLFDGRELDPPQKAGDAGLARCADGSLVAVLGCGIITDNEDGYIFDEDGMNLEHRSGSNRFRGCRGLT